MRSIRPRVCDRWQLVCAVDCREAPDCAFPALLDDAMAAYKELFSGGVAPSTSSCWGTRRVEASSLRSRTGCATRGCQWPASRCFSRPGLTSAAQRGLRQQHGKLDRPSARRALRFHYTRADMSHALRLAANAIWPLVRAYNARFERPSPHPKWAPAPLLKRRERTFPPLGWPRETDSLCPRCVKEARTAILDGSANLRLLIDGRPGEVRAHIVEEDGAIVMTKTCAKHGTFRDVMSIDPAFTACVEGRFPGRDFVSPATKLRNHGTSSIKYGLSLIHI